MKSPRSSLLLLATIASQLAGCALVSRGETLQVRYYTLDDRAAEHAAGSKSELALRLGRVDASGGLGEQIAVRKGTHEISYREDQRWTERPAQFVRRELERALFSERGLTRSYSGHTPQMEVELIELELVEADKQAQARVRLTAQIRDDRRSLCHDNFETQLPVEADPRADMERSVAALSSALHRTVEQVASRAVDCLAASAKDSAKESASSSRNASKARESREPEQPADTSSLANAEQ
ncbi:MAG TPA: ABC-type transport auxiliary lipoprotein family protein [Polyangiales bacterium]|nr:ABC-type transport auxiliary lipoprotein family protein [Polyangiales bacterium]